MRDLGFHPRSMRDRPFPLYCPLSRSAGEVGGLQTHQRLSFRSKAQGTTKEASAKNVSSVNYGLIFPGRVLIPDGGSGRPGLFFTLRTSLAKLHG